MKGKRKPLPDTGNGSIPYTGKDIVMKILSETYGAKSFSVYGLELPPIKAFLPTELPYIEARHQYGDNIFLLENGEYALVEYESRSSAENMFKYLGYAARLGEKHREGGGSLRLRVIVIYTCDVESAEDTLDLGSVRITVEQAFLSHIDGEAECGRLEGRIQSGERLSDEDLMRLAILPLTVKGGQRKRGMIDRVIDAADRLRQTDDSAGSFALSAMTVAAWNYMSKAQEERIMEVMEMTRIGWLYEQKKKRELEEALEEAVKKAEERVEERAAKDKAEAVKETEERAAKDKAEAVKETEERAAKDKAEAVREAEERARACQIVDLVDAFAKRNNITSEDACERIGVGLEHYRQSRLLATG